MWLIASWRCPPCSSCSSLSLKDTFLFFFSPRPLCNFPTFFLSIANIHHHFVFTLDSINCWPCPSTLVLHICYLSLSICLSILLFICFSLLPLFLSQQEALMQSYMHCDTSFMRFQLQVYKGVIGSLELKKLVHWAIASVTGSLQGEKLAEMVSCTGVKAVVYFHCSCEQCLPTFQNCFSNSKTNQESTVSLAHEPS